MISSASLAAEDPLDANSRRNRSHFSPFQNLLRRKQAKNKTAGETGLTFLPRRRQAYWFFHSLPLEKTSDIPNFHFFCLERNFHVFQYPKSIFWDPRKVLNIVHMQGPWLLWLFLHNSLHSWDYAKDVCVWCPSKGWLYAISRYLKRHK